jgi:hypothetical protein
MTNDYLPKEWENRLGQAIKLANVIRDPKAPTAEYLQHLDHPTVRRGIEHLANTGLRSEATWQAAIKIATEVR